MPRSPGSARGNRRAPVAIEQGGEDVQRIRTIKPSFFVSDDICALSPLARLLYIGLWCEADREGRLVWSPRVFKRRYLPDDVCDIHKLCEELVGNELVVPYGEGFAHIPSFLKHQRVNLRETASHLPEPPGDARPRKCRAAPDEEEGMGPAASAASNMASPFAEVLFGEFLSWLVANSGRTEIVCRGLLGKWRKDLADDSLVAILDCARAQRVAEPVAWITAAIQNQKDPRRLKRRPVFN
jgi:hypothetical protein